MDFLIHYLEISLIKLNSNEKGSTKKEHRSSTTRQNKMCLNGFNQNLSRIMWFFPLSLLYSVREIFDLFAKSVESCWIFTLCSSINRDSLTVNIWLKYAMQQRIHLPILFLKKIVYDYSFICWFTLREMNFFFILITKFEQHLDMYSNHHFMRKMFKLFRNFELFFWRATIDVIIRQLCEIVRWIYV